MNQKQTERAASVRNEMNARAIYDLQQKVIKQAKRIEQLETCAVINAETIGHVAELRRTVAEQARRIERLEAATRGLTAIETTKALGCRVEELEAAVGCYYSPCPSL